ncbi:hypothetical protein BsWGS_12088 [Bradybaena similaris]
MLVKRLRLLVVLSAVMWTTLSRSVQDSGTQQPTTEPEPETTSPPEPEPETTSPPEPEPETTSPPEPEYETTTPPEPVYETTPSAEPEPESPPTTKAPGCDDGGRFYKPGEYIYSGACGSAQCMEDGSIQYGDVFCDSSDNDGRCNEVDEPNACCRACQQPTIEPEPETTSPPEPVYETTPPLEPEYETTPSAEPEPESPPTTKAPGCDDGGRFYKPGEYIYSGACGSAQCMEDGSIEYGDVFCDSSDNDGRCNEVDEPNACCRACQQPTTEPEPETTSPPEPVYETTPPLEPEYETTPSAEPEPESPPTTKAPGCDDGGRFYKPGEYIYSGACGSAQCMEDGSIEYGDVFCDSSDNDGRCNEVDEPNACCRACQPPTTEPEFETTPPPDPEYETTPFAEPEPESPPTTKAPGCNVNGRFYKPGEYIYSGACGSAQCMEDGSIEYGDVFCDSSDNDGRCNEVDEPNACCRACQTEVYTKPETPPTTEPYPEPDEPETTTPQPPGCIDNNRYYEIGEYIYKSNCSSEQCTADGKVVSDIFCDTTPEEQRPCNTYYEPNACCPPCKPPEIIVDPTLPESTDDSTTPEIIIDPIFVEDEETTASDIPTRQEGCWDTDNAIFYRTGQYVNYNKCSYTLCTQDGRMVTGAIFCDTRSGCNREQPPNECCPACQNPTGETEVKQIKPYHCHLNGKKYQLGEYISYQPCTRVRCTKYGPLHEGTLCQSDAGCNTDWPANDCCPACPFETTTAIFEEPPTTSEEPEIIEEPAPRRSPGQSIPLRRGDVKTTTAIFEEPPTTSEEPEIIEEPAPRRSPGQSIPLRRGDVKSRHRRNIERTKVKRHTFRDSAEGYRLIRKRSAFGTPGIYMI